MISFHFKLQNPFSYKQWSPIKSWHGVITKNKGWEVETFKSNDLLLIWIEFTNHRDHGGLELTFGLFAYTIAISICDRRHWDFDNKKWEE